MYFVVVAGELHEQPIIGAVVLFLFTFEYYGCKFTKKKKHHNKFANSRNSVMVNAFKFVFSPA